uniref:Uncharacterized protein n=1 Tax=Amphiprion percula TaxID=161767 RepID=A0A3P8RZ26_AMPPE
MSTGALYNDQGGAEAAVEAGQESTPTSSGSGAAFGLFSEEAAQLMEADLGRKNQGCGGEEQKEPC